MLAPPSAFGADHDQPDPAERRVAQGELGDDRVIIASGNAGRRPPLGLSGAFMGASVPGAGSLPLLADGRNVTAQVAFARHFGHLSW
ncbi:hypothetical protein [Nonomuraea sediminis]|uniref:hypothetical protein n=1 Tax=Nonomuraea sediminis TaxID=2835864 RepID=UPI001BDBE4BD|nr:hypothetical protein [Nonomuraea sediminis]